MSRQPFEIIESGQGAVLLQFGNSIDESVNSRIRLFCATYEKNTQHAAGIIEIAPAYCSVTVYFDPLVTTPENVVRYITQTAETGDTESATEQPRTFDIPVCYDGSSAPDMENVITHTHLTKEQIIAAHSGQAYLIYMLGFLPGFAYLGGMDSRLNTPRLKTPRTKIPAGSVAIGGSQTGIYPVDSPGGWQIIGWTPVKPFDPDRNPQILFRAGDKIRFEPVTEKELEHYGKEHIFPLSHSTSTTREKSRTVQSGIKIISGGTLTTVQDAGRAGYQKDGVGVSGAMDRISYAAANSIAGNPPGSAVLETTLAGPELQFTLDTDFVITGAPLAPVLDSVPVPLYTRVHAAAGSILQTGFPTAGLRSYIAFSGGILVPEVLGSSSTNCTCRLGGYYGRRLQQGDELAIGEKTAAGNLFPPADILNKLQTAPQSPQKPKELRVLPGPQKNHFSEKAVQAFTESVFTVTADSDRMGCRLSGPQIQCDGGTDIISDSIPEGSVQITSSGQPVVMTADRQTTGGYAKIAIVIKADLPCIGQAVPGTAVRFLFVSEDEADSALREQKSFLDKLNSISTDGRHNRVY
jgi:KipI family sensor histidine kinase inhibitor